MTKSTITRERLQEIAEDGFLKHGESKVLARMVLAAIDGEPVAEVVSIYGDPEAFGEREIRPLVGIQQMPYGTKLYRHAQPASVVDADDNFYSWFGREWAENYQHNQYTTAAKQMLGVMAESAWKAGRRAAMLQEFQKSAGAEATCRGSENAQVLNTKSPAQSDCCPAQNSVSPAQGGNSPATSDDWQVEAEKLAEMHGMSFVLFRHGEAPQCADPTKVVISFTDKGLGHDTLPAATQEVKGE